MSSYAIITGGTKGIGKGIALQLAKDNYDLLLTHVSPLSKEKENEILNEFKDYDIKVIIKQADVSNIEACQLLVDFIKEEDSIVEVLVNNAGITKDNLFIKMSSDDFIDVVNTNLVGTFNMSKVISKIMIKQKYGRIINISSVIGEIGNVGQVNYAASKAGVIGFSKSLAKELASRNITVNCVAPGFICTDMTEKLDEKVVQQILSNIPLKKLGEVEDVANVVSFLASKKTSYVTGQVINVCGGMVM